MKTPLALHNVHPHILVNVSIKRLPNDDRCSELIKITMKTHLNLHTVHFNVLYIQNHSHSDILDA